MRKYLILAAIILVQVVLLGILLPKALAANSTPVHANCLRYAVKFNAPAAWQKSSSNRTIQIGCSGQTNHLGPQSCEGGVLTLKPGQIGILGNCSCFNKKGCLVVGQKLSRTKDTKNNKWDVEVVPGKGINSTLGNKCSVTYVNRDTQKKANLASFCGTNKQKFNIGINIKCTVTKPTPTFTPTPTPGICVGPKPVTNVKVTCPTCDAQGQPQPTPTPIGEGGDCFNNQNACAPGLVCANGGLCEPQPTITPTPTIEEGSSQ